MIIFVYLPLNTVLEMCPNLQCLSVIKREVGSMTQTVVVKQQLSWQLTQTLAVTRALT